MPRQTAALTSDPLMLGRYRPLRPLGSGGSGAVWLARDERTGLDVALKIVPREGNGGPRAEREARAAAKLRHKHCLRAYTLSRDASHVYIAYEYVPGRTLREALRAGELNDRDAVEVAAQILEGIAHAHAHGIVHRDVKPSNVLLAEGGGVDARLLDFGLALVQEAETLTHVGDVPGTLAYISPERLRGDQGGPAADVWSVAVMLWEALAGFHPFWNGSLQDTARSIREGLPSLDEPRPDLPEALRHAIGRAGTVAPAQRPAAGQLAVELREAFQRRRRRGRRTTGAAPPREIGRALPKRLVPAALSAATAGWVAATLPFYPPGWPAGLAFAAAAASLVRERLGLAVALAVPLFPLANLSLGAALVYAAAALAWLALTWRDPRLALFLAVGPLAAPIAALGLLPLAAQAVRGRARRTAQVAAAVLVTGLVAGLNHDGLPFTGESPPLSLGIEGSEKPLAVAFALLEAVRAHPALVLEALALGLAAAAIPLVRGRGLWPIAGFGAGMLASTLLLVPSASALPLVAATWLTCAALAGERFLTPRAAPASGQGRESRR
jgi:eukaryotic-like serine/threonine-protein kinase